MRALRAFEFRPPSGAFNKAVFSPVKLSPPSDSVDRRLPGLPSENPKEEFSALFFDEAEAAAL